MNKAVFLDRDGVINEVQTKRVKFVNHPSDLYIINGVPEAIAKIRELGYMTFIVTNQGGVGLGYISEKMLDKIHKRLKRELLKLNASAVINDIAVCIHRPNEGCNCRKPNSGMILNLAEKFAINLSESYMIGDMETDVMAGKKVGCKTVFIGETNNTQADYICPDLRTFARLL
ncbi:D-glycero-beta-D-manno-heptose-1,7-bisphosphate 7-phosphatase [Thermoflavimicrobium daqui]|uniref:D,D-heptose 1,7-bisphosphate phosphatase n=1 Tax=Thermoflavimicrobium daqui TaxID=2137476 RepID=A0A364K3W0_9BACL|nr:HAD family hydrolase [Thermoflavimicrobium daqui]RAL24064.1 D-glycero-beta-D-manno-heptose-1,7-bisphosphate 7-phosphatase [Thermoflavimicrobium daqui]